MIRPLRIFSVLLLAGAGIALGQQPVSAQTPQKFELNAFGGGTYFFRHLDPFKTKLVTGGIGGGSFTVNGQFWSVESRTAYGTNNIRFFNVPQGTLDLGSRTFETMLNPVVHFTNRTSRIRPYITAGVGVNSYRPTDEAKTEASNSANTLLFASITHLHTSTRATFNYGGGVKLRLKKDGALGLRFDVRGLLSDNPRFGFAEVAQPGTVFIKNGTLNGLQTTVGLTWIFGKDHPKPVAEIPPPPPPPPAPAPLPPPPPPPVPQNVIGVSEIQGSAADVCAGGTANLTVTNTSTFPVRYQWTLNGTNVGTNQNSYTLSAPDAGGNQNVSVQITDASGSTRSATTVTRNISMRTRPYVRPTVQSTLAGPASVMRGDVVTANAAGQGDCGGALSYTWTASEGTVTAAGQRATYDTKNVAFGPNTDRDELKQVTLTATVRDTRGNTATGPVVVTVRRVAEVVRLPDILFSSKSSFVNNCGKRILLEEVFPKVRSGNYTVVLVGHNDDKEKVANLDRDRAYSAAKVLVAGADTQVRIEPMRVKADWVGTSQTAPKEPGFCGTSTRPAAAETASRTIEQNDPSSENRRVEVWLVPAGMTMPQSVANAKDLPATIHPPK